MLVCFIYVFYYLPREGEKQNFKVLFQEKECNSEIFYQTKKGGICFNVNQLLQITLHWLVIYSMFF